MNKREFLAQLRKKLSGLPEKDIEERLTFYSEMIDDRIEDGVPEETAVGETGTVDEIAEQIIADIPLGKIVREKIKPKKKPDAWKTVLLVLGSPVWLPLLIALLAVIFSLYAVLWTVTVVMWAVFACLAACGPAFIAAGIYFAVNSSAISGAAVIGAGLACIGSAVLAFFGCKAASKGILFLTRKSAIGIKNIFIGRETAQ